MLTRSIVAALAVAVALAHASGASAQAAASFPSKAITVIVPASPDTLAAVQPHIKSGAVRALAVTTAKRVPGVDLPTMAEAGLPGYETSTWGGIFAPAKTPKDVVAKLNAEYNKALATPEVKTKLEEAGIQPAGGTPQQLADFLQSEMTTWAKVAHDAKIQPE